MLLKILAGVLVAAAVGGATTTATQAPPNDRDTILKLARDGHTVDAWKAWEALPRTPDQLRMGITLAITTRQLTRGIDLYDTLVTETGKPDRQSLTDLALQTAEELSESSDVDVRVNACAAALLLDKTNAACRRALNLVAQSREIDDQALGVYAMANAGMRPSPGVMSSLAATMPKSLRLQLAQRMTHLTGPERLALLQPLLDDPDMATRYEAVLSATEIPGPEVATALANLESRPLAEPLKTAVMLALARHGDKSRLNAVVERLPSFSGFDKVTAGRILASANDKRGVDLLNEMLKSGTDIERVQAAAALAQINPKAARRVMLESLHGGGAAIRQSATLMAGSLELGTDSEIYRKLTDAVPAIRAAAVEAISATFWVQDNRARPSRVQ
jgi:HEAT repeat protein